MEGNEKQIISKVLEKISNMRKETESFSELQPFNKFIGSGPYSKVFTAHFHGIEFAIKIMQI